jgi:hypothetical protein
MAISFDQCSIQALAKQPNTPIGKDLTSLVLLTNAVPAAADITNGQLYQAAIARSGPAVYVLSDVLASNDAERKDLPVRFNNFNYVIVFKMTMDINQPWRATAIGAFAGVANQGGVQPAQRNVPRLPQSTLPGDDYANIPDMGGSPYANAVPDMSGNPYANAP